MTDERRFEELWAELNRIGVDPYSFPAGLTLSREEAIRVAATLPDGAGPTAFLAAIRADQQRSREATDSWTDREPDSKTA